VLTGLRAHPAVQGAARLQENAIARLVGWASLTFAEREMAEGPVLLIATADGTTTVVAILAAPHTFTTNCWGMRDGRNNPEINLGMDCTPKLRHAEP
jgi:hypothetical protein